MTKLECCVAKAGNLVPELGLLLRVLCVIILYRVLFAVILRMPCPIQLKIIPSFTESCFTACGTTYRQRSLWFRICPYNLGFGIHCHGPWGIKEQVFTEPLNLPEILPGSFVFFHLQLTTQVRTTQLSPHRLRNEFVKFMKVLNINKLSEEPVK